MKEVGGRVLLHDTPGSIVGDCGHLVDLGNYFVRLYLKEGGIPYRFDVCSVECMRRICREKDLEVELNGHGWVPASPYSRSRKHVGEITTL